MKNFRTNTTAVVATTAPVTGGRPARLRSGVLDLR